MYRCCLCLILLGFTFLSPLLPAPAIANDGAGGIFAAPLELTAGKSADHLIDHIRYHRGLDDEVTAETLAALAAPGKMRSATSENYGPPGERLVLTLAVQNASDVRGRWTMTTDRMSFRDLAIGQYDNGALRWIALRADPDFSASLRAFNGLAYDFELGPGETAQYVITFTGDYTSILPLRIDEPQSAIVRQKLRSALIAACVAGMLVLITASVLLYFLTGKRDFAWLGVCETIHAFYVIHVSGYTISFFLHDKDPWLYLIGSVIPPLYGAAAFQFARRLLDTKDKQPQFDRFMRFIIAASLVVCAFHIGSAALGNSSASFVWTISSLLVIVTYRLGLLWVAFQAVRRNGLIYAPLLLAWLTTTGSTLYGVLIARDFFGGLSRDWHIIGPVGLFSSMCIMATVALHVRKIFEAQRETHIELVNSLTEKLEIQEDSLRLQMERTAALELANNQGRLLQASGHDSKQVLLALKGMARFMEEARDNTLPADLPKIMRASAAHLENVISTTMAGRNVAQAHSGPLALSCFKPDDLVQQLELIYRPMAEAKGLSLKVEASTGLWQISDRALLARAFSNFLSNAVKFSDAGKVYFGVTRRADNVQFTMTDDGPGIDAALLKRLLERKPSSGQSGPSESEGLGFGFRAAIDMIEKVGGRFEIETEPGKGTNLSVVVPTVSQKGIIEASAFIHHARTRGIEVILDSSLLPLGKKTKLRPVPLVSDRSAIGRNATNLVFLQPPSLDMLDHPVVLAILQEHRTESRELVAR